VTYQEKPTATIRAALKELLTGNLGEGIVFYEYFPAAGVRGPCVVAQNVAGFASDIAIGEDVDSGKKGHDITIVLQFDVYHSTSDKRDELADKFLFVIWKGRAWLKDEHGIEYSPPKRIQDLQPGQTGEHLYGKSIDIAFTITMTAIT